MIRITEVTEPDARRVIARTVLEALTDWFEITETREAYIAGSAGMDMVAAFDGDCPVGFLCLKETGRDTAEIAVMGVLRACHRSGIGTKLFEAAKGIAAGKGYSFLQVKTVREGLYVDYDETNRFYRSLGFREFEVFPDLWDKANPCQVYVMAL